MTGRQWMGLALLGAASLACQPLHGHFVRTDDTFAPIAKAEVPRVWLERSEVDAAPPYHVVGLVEVRGMESDPVKAWLAEAESAGAAAGCDVLVQRGAYEHRPWKVRVSLSPAVQVKRPNGGATWQFYCGVAGEKCDSTAADRALKLALQSQEEEHGGGCHYAARTGSHIETFVCE